MDWQFMFFGIAICVFGGILLCAIIFGVLLWFLCDVWINASNKFRDVCSGESLIFEYRNNRKAFLKWKEEQEKQGKKVTR